MSVDKFGHYSNEKYSNENLKKTESKLIGITMDNDQNINMQNRRIKNVGVPIQETDAITKRFMQAHVTQAKENIINYINTENKQIQITLENTITRTTSDLETKIRAFVSKHIQVYDDRKNE